MGLTGDLEFDNSNYVTRDEIFIELINRALDIPMMVLEGRVLMSAFIIADGMVDRFGERPFQTLQTKHWNNQAVYFDGEILESKMQSLAPKWQEL